MDHNNQPAAANLQAYKDLPGIAADRIACGIVAPRLRTGRDSFGSDKERIFTFG